MRYLPEASNWDGKFHKLRVAVSRKGITLQNEQGYTAIKTPEIAEKDRLSALLQHPMDEAEIGLRVVVSAGPQPRTLHLRIAVDARDLLLIPQGDRSVAQLMFTFGGYLGNGRVQTYAPIPIGLNLTAEQQAKVERDGLRFGHDLTVGEQAQRVRLVVVDRNGGTSGTVTIPIEVSFTPSSAEKNQ